MSNRYWTSNPQRSVESKGHGPAYSRDGGKVLDDRETQPPYNANIGPDGPDLNRVGFSTVKAFVKAHFMRIPAADKNAYDRWDAPGGFGGPEGPQEGITREDVVHGAKAAINAIREATAEDKPGLKVYEPSGRNAGSAPVPTEFSQKVKRMKR